MSEYHSLSHSKWNCKYHLVFIPKKRRKIFFGEIRKDIGAIFKDLAQQKECNIIEGHLMPDHVHMCIEIPPKHAVSSIVGFIKGKSAINVSRSQLALLRVLRRRSFKCVLVFALVSFCCLFCLHLPFSLLNLW